jgi:hypothetical protein
MAGASDNYYYIRINSSTLNMSMHIPNMLPGVRSASFNPFRRPKIPRGPFFEALGNPNSRCRIGLEKRIGTSENVSTPPAIIISA